MLIAQPIFNIPLNTFDCNPNNFYYFWGLIIALLINFLVARDLLQYFFVFVNFFFQSKDKYIKKFIRRTGLKSIYFKDIYVKYYWIFTISIFFIELICSLIMFFFFKKTLLYISLLMWFGSFFWSIILLTFVRSGLSTLKETEQEKEYFLFLMKKIENHIKLNTNRWKLEEIAKHGTEYTEAILLTRITRYRDREVRLAKKFSKTREAYLVFIIEEVEAADTSKWTDDELFRFNLLMENPTYYNFVNVILYVYYFFRCSNDCKLIYDFFYLFNFFPKIPGYESYFANYISNIDFDIINKLYCELDSTSLVFF